jgi:hypothetical protein
LVSFVLAFGLLGIAKMLPPRPEGFIASSMLLVVLARQLQRPGRNGSGDDHPAYQES